MQLSLRGIGYVTGFLFLSYFYFQLVFLNLYTPPPGQVPSGTLLGNVDFLIHETGHYVVFSPLFFHGTVGEFIHVLGGALTQWLVPFLFTLYFLRTRQFYSSFVTFF